MNEGRDELPLAVAGQLPIVVRLKPGVEMAFVWIPSGEFVMGERWGAQRDETWRAQEEPRHGVRITQGLFLGATPVTQAQFGVWTSALAERGEVPPDGAHENRFEGRPAHPAENVSWRDSAMYCAWLTARVGDAGAAPGTPPANGGLGGWVATLPTEAEWEYACRAGTTTEYWSGDGEAALRAVGWFDGNAGESTQPVGRLAPNPWGLYDVHGNVDEWCWDPHDAEAYATRPDGVPDPGHVERAAWLVRDSRDGLKALPGARDPVRVVRGGSWNNPARFCRSAFRNWRNPGFRIGDRGFRVCLVPGPRASQTGAPETEPGGTPRRSRRARGASRTALSGASFPRRRR
jgi:formylglycine-generating enzyme required for sulfatase activity